MAGAETIGPKMSARSSVGFVMPLPDRAAGSSSMRSIRLSFAGIWLLGGTALACVKRRWVNAYPSSGGTGFAAAT